MTIDGFAAPPLPPCGTSERRALRGVGGLGAPDDGDSSVMPLRELASVRASDSSVGIRGALSGEKNEGRSLTGRASRGAPRLAFSSSAVLAALFVLVIAVAASVTLLVIQSRNFSVIEAAGTRIEGITSSASSGEKDSSRSSDASETSSAQEKQKSDIQQKDEAGGAASEKTAEKSPSAENKPTAQTSPQDVRIDINSADATLLDTVKGIGPATAQKIIDYRTQNGRFASVDALVAVPGIGAKTLESMRSQLVAR